MKYINLLKSKKKLIWIIGIIAIAGITGLYFYSQKLPTYKIIINPTELLPFTSHEQARANVCSTMKGQLFDEICQEKYNNVSKNDAEKISELFFLLKQVENNSHISDYERSLLGQAIFASLPTKDSPLVLHTKPYPLLTKFNNFINRDNVAYAAEPNDNLGIGKEAFKKMMAEDFKQVVGNNIPKGDNAWSIIVMISQYKWIDGERQPIYSEQSGEIYDPYPGTLDDDKQGRDQEVLVHVYPIVGSYMSSQNIHASLVKEGTSEMIVYDFSINSWYSKPYETDSSTEVEPPVQFIESYDHFTEEGYAGDDLLADLLNVVKMPSKRQINKNQKKTVPPPGTPIESSDAEFICETPGCEACISDPMVGLYCFDNLGKIEELAGVKTTSGDEFNLAIIDLLKGIEPTYRYTDAPNIEESPTDFPEFIEQNQASQEPSYDSNYPKYNNQMRWLDCVKNSSLEEAENCDEILNQPEDDSYQPTQETGTGVYIPDSVHIVPR